MSRGTRSTRDMFIREVRGLISWDGKHFGASDLQVCYDDFAWQVQHFVWPGLTFSWQARYFRQMEWKNRKMHWHKAVSSALNFPFLKGISQNCFVFDVVNLEILWKFRVSQNGFVFDVVKFKTWGSLAERCLFYVVKFKIQEVSQISFVFKLAHR